jgi:hypothetical protein
VRAFPVLIFTQGRSCLLAASIEKLIFEHFSKKYFVKKLADDGCKNLKKTLSNLL